MSLDYPANPAVDEVFDRWRWDGSKWVLHDPYPISDGWHHIGSGTSDKMQLLVPPTANRIRVTWHASNSDAASFNARVNNDSTAALHVRSRSTITPSGTYSEVEDGVEGTVYRAGTFLGILASWGTFEIDATQPTCAFSSFAYRGGIPSGSARMVGWGWLSANRTLQSVTMFPSVGTLNWCTWQAEGYFNASTPRDGNEDGNPTPLPFP